MGNSTERLYSVLTNVVATLRGNFAYKHFFEMLQEKNSLSGNNSTHQTKSVSLHETQLHTYFKDKRPFIEEVTINFLDTRDVFETVESLLKLVNYAQTESIYGNKDLEPKDVLNCTQLIKKLIPQMPFVLYDEIKEDYVQLKNDKR